MLKSISRNASYSVSLLVVLVLAASAAFAQVPPDNNVEQAAVQVISMVTASASAERVRFTSPNTVVQLRLEVYDEAGQKLLDTEQRGGNVLDWHLQGGAGERVSDGVYLCVLTVKNLAGRLNQKLGLVTVNGQSTVVRSAAVAELNLRQTLTVGPVESREAGLTVMDGSDAPVTVLANNGSEAQLARTRGALTFRIGNFFSGNDKEQMRLTEDGNLGLGTTKPKVKLDVAGVIRAREGFMFSDGSTLKLNEKGVLTRTNADGSAPSAVTTTQNKLAKFTDNAGTVGDSVVTESAGNIGLGTPTPSQALDVANGRIVTTGNKTLAASFDSMIEVQSTITNNGLAQSAIKTRNTFNGPGDFVTGIDGSPTFAPSASINTAQGFVAAAFFAPPPGVTITNALGGASATAYSNVSGAVTNGTAFSIVSPFVFGALRPTNQYGLRINNQGMAGTTNTYGLFVDAQSGSLNNYSAIFAGGNVGIGTTTPGFKLHVVGQDVRVESNTPGIFPRFSLNFTGGNTDEKRWQNYASPGALNFTALNDAETAETFWLQVKRGTGTAISSVVFPNGTVESKSGGFKFPDGSVQTTAANATYTNRQFAETAIPTNGTLASVLHLDLPPGTYVLWATVEFINSANFGGVNNNRTLFCRFSDDANLDQAYVFDIAGFSRLTTTFHSIPAVSSPGSVDLKCAYAALGALQDSVTVTQRRITALKTEGNVVIQ